MHVDEDLAEPAVLVLASAQIKLVAADHRLLGVTLAALGQFGAALGPRALDHPLDDPLDDPFGDHRGSGAVGSIDDVGDDLVFVVLHPFEHAGGQGLAELGAVAVEGVGLEAEAPGQEVGFLAVGDGGAVEHVDGLGDGAGDEGLGRRHHADVGLGRERAGADPAAGAGAIEHRQVALTQEGRAFQGHGAAAIGVGGLDLGLGEAEPREKVETRLIQFRVRHLEGVGAELVAEGPAVGGKADVEGVAEGVL